jgi:hypothetical protein
VTARKQRRSRGGLSDTTPAARRVQAELLRRKTPVQRFELACDWSAAIIGLSRDALRRQHPAASEQELRSLLVLRIYGRELGERFAAALQRRGRP